MRTTDIKRILIACLLVLTGWGQANDPPPRARDSCKKGVVLPSTRDVVTAHPLRAGDANPATSSFLSLTEPQTAGLAWLRKQVAPPPRFADHDARISAQRRALPLADGRSQDVVLVHDRERVIGVWNQGSNPGMRRFHLLVTKPGTGLDEARLKALLARHLCRFGYDAQWSPGGAIATVSPWFPSESEPPDRIEVTLGPAGSA